MDSVWRKTRKTFPATSALIKETTCFSETSVIFTACKSCDIEKNATATNDLFICNGLLSRNAIRLTDEEGTGQDYHRSATHTVTRRVESYLHVH